MGGDDGRGALQGQADRQVRVRCQRPGQRIAERDPPAGTVTDGDPANVSIRLLPGTIAGAELDSGTPT